MTEPRRWPVKLSRGDGTSPAIDDVRCPFCGSAEAACISLFGSQLLTSQYRCQACSSYFEALRATDRGV